MDGFVAILICAGSAVATLFCSMWLGSACSTLKEKIPEARALFAMIRAWQYVCAIFGGVAVAATLILIAAWIVTWW